MANNGPARAGGLISETPPERIRSMSTPWHQVMVSDLLVLCICLWLSHQGHDDCYAVFNVDGSDARALMERGSSLNH